MAKYKEVTFSIGPTLKLNEGTYIKTSVSITTVVDGPEFKVEEVMADLRRLYYRALKEELLIVKHLDNKNLVQARIHVRKELEKEGS